MAIKKYQSQFTGEQIDTKLTEVDGKLNKTTDPSVVYANDVDGNPSVLGVQQDATQGNGLVQRTEQGHIVVPTVPAANNHAASKEYVDNIAGGGGGGVSAIEINVAENPTQNLQNIKVDNVVYGLDAHNVAYDNSNVYDSLQELYTVKDHVSAITKDTTGTHVAGNLLVNGAIDTNEVPIFRAGANMLSNNIIGVANPTLDHHAANKSYVDGAVSVKANSVDLATVATSGSYNDLSNKPTIPTTTGELTNNSDFATTTYVDTEIANLVDSEPETMDTLGELAIALKEHEDAYDSLLTVVGGKANSADLATVATSGEYNDLLNKPTIPTPNDATLTIQKNGTSIGTFTANASENETVNIEIPTTVAELSDASNYQAQLVSGTNIKTINGATLLGSGDLSVGTKLYRHKVERFGETSGSYELIIYIYSNDPTPIKNLTQFKNAIDNALSHKAYIQGMYGHGSYYTYIFDCSVEPTNYQATFWYYDVINNNIKQETLVMVSEEFEDYITEL